MAKRWYRDLWLLIITVMLIVIVVEVWRVSTRADVNTDALCSLRADLQQRVSDSERFLARHPRAAGVFAVRIRESAAADRHAVRALASVGCDRGGCGAYRQAGAGWHELLREAAGMHEPERGCLYLKHPYKRFVRGEITLKQLQEKTAR